MSTKTGSYSIDIATIQKQLEMAASISEVKVSMTPDQIVEEPCEVKISSTVLKTTQEGDLPPEFIKLAEDCKNITFTD